MAVDPGVGVGVVRAEDGMEANTSGSGCGRKVPAGRWAGADGATPVETPERSLLDRSVDDSRIRESAIRMTQAAAI